MIAATVFQNKEKCGEGVFGNVEWLERPSLGGRWTGTSPDSFESHLKIQGIRGRGYKKGKLCFNKVKHWDLIQKRAEQNQKTPSLSFERERFSYGGKRGGGQRVGRWTLREAVGGTKERELRPRSQQGKRRGSAGIRGGEKKERAKRNEKKVRASSLKGVEKQGKVTSKGGREGN